MKTDFDKADSSEKLKALLAIAGNVQQCGKRVTSDSRYSSDCRCFCVHNRYVDGFGQICAPDLETYRGRTASVAAGGYKRIPSDVKAYIHSATDA